MSKWNWKELKTYNIKQRVLILLAVLIFWIGGPHQFSLYPDSALKVSNFVITMFVVIGAVFLFQD